ncbi:MAG TPA: MraY family glycosyltransferase [Actinomycetota bacterium]|nr:MraY family glycosyltransferase [Actinomycetota bacterium]
MSAYLIVFVAAAAVTVVATPLVRVLAIRTGAIYQPGDRTVHTRPLPTLGGLAMYLGLLAGLAVSYALPFFREVHEARSDPLATVVTATLIVALGLVDDAKGVLPLTKLTAQIFIGGVLVLLGVELAWLWVPFVSDPAGETWGQTVVLSGGLGTPLTILWVVAIVNAVNLIDGLDGLAAGMVAIAAGAFFAYMVNGDSYFGTASEPALLAAVTAGICVGFLPWNFHPAKIFMGDTGSMLLGLLLAVATISGVGRNPYPPSSGDFAAIAGPVLVPLLALFIPFLDVVAAIVRRTRRRQSIGHPDKEHLHHRLMDVGHSHRQAVLLMYLWSVLIAGSALAVGLIDGRLQVGLILVAAVALFLATVLPRLAVRRNGNGNADVTQEAASSPGSADPDPADPAVPRGG